MKLKTAFAIAAFVILAASVPPYPMPASVITTMYWCGTGGRVWLRFIEAVASIVAAFFAAYFLTN
jgi:hypothetical protein